MTNEQWEESDDKALSMIQLCLATNVRREVLDQTITTDPQLQLEEALYMAKSLANEIRLKERLYM